MSNQIKMRVNNDSESFCSNCGMKYKNTKEMYDLMLFGKVNQICFKCVDVLFQKTLKAQISYQGKIKTKEDLARIKRSEALKQNNEN